MLAVAGCATGHQAPGIVSTASAVTSQPVGIGTVAAAPTEAPCGADALRVTVEADTDHVDVLVRNASDAACQLTGSPPVAIVLARVHEPERADGPAALPRGATYTVSFVRVVGETACPTPIPSGTHRPGDWTVVVDGDPYSAPGFAELQVNAVNCIVYDRLPAVITS
jgi:hypothetical protein